MIARLAAALGRLVSDQHVQGGSVEMRIAVAQAVFVWAPIVVIGIAIMAVMP